MTKEKPERDRSRDFAHSWLESKTPKIKWSTAEHYATVLDDHVLPYLGDFYVDVIGKDEIEDWSEKQWTTDCSDETLKSRYRVLRTLARAAAGKFRLPDPPAAVELRLPGREAKEKDTLLPDELLQLLVFVEEKAPQHFALVLTLALTGSRWGAVTGLKWDDIDEDAGVIHFRRAHYKKYVSTPKTRVSKRTVPLHPWLKDALREHRQRLVKEQHPGLHEGWVFATRSKGNRDMAALCYPSSLQKSLPKWLAEVGIRKHITPHSFRGVCHDLHRWVGTDPIVENSLIGHATESMGRGYSTVVSVEQRQAMVNMVDLIQGRRAIGSGG